LDDQNLLKIEETVLIVSYISTTKAYRMNILALSLAYSCRWNHKPNVSVVVRNCMCVLLCFYVRRKCEKWHFCSFM